MAIDQESASRKGATEPHGFGPLERLISAHRRNDMEEVRSVLHPDIEVIEAEGLPYAGTYRGHEEYIALHLKMEHYFSEFHLDLKEVIEARGGDRVVAMWDARVICRSTGKSVSFPLAEVAYVRDGRIYKIVPFYFSTHAIAEALKP